MPWVQGLGGTRAEQGGNWNLANNVVIKTVESEFKGTKGDYFGGSFLISLILYSPHLRRFNIPWKVVRIKFYYIQLYIIINSFIFSNVIEDYKKRSKYYKTICFRIRNEAYLLANLSCLVDHSLDYLKSNVFFSTISNKT